MTTDLDGDYVYRLVVNDGSEDSAPDTVTVTATTTNAAPVADAGADQTVATGVVADLDGSGSSDADGDLLSYTWTWVSKPSGSQASLSNISSETPAFTPDVDGDYVIKLAVNDGTVSGEDQTKITASSTNIPPVAELQLGTLDNMMPTMQLYNGRDVYLDGSSSYDPDGSLVFPYKWKIVSKPANHDNTLDDATTAEARFYAEWPGEYIVKLTVDDGTATATDTMTVQLNGTVRLYKYSGVPGPNNPPKKRDFPYTFDEGFISMTSSESVTYYRIRTGNNDITIEDLSTTLDKTADSDPDGPKVSVEFADLAEGDVIPASDERIFKMIVRNQGGAYPAKTKFKAKYKFTIKEESTGETFLFRYQYKDSTAIAENY